MVPSLPLELEREIFETAAYRYPKGIPTLLLVCHRVHTWIEPLLYRALAITYEGEKLLAALESAMQTKAAGFLERAVQHVFIDSDSDPSRTTRYRKLLEGCSRITDLYICGPFDSELLPVLSGMRLQRFALTAPPSLRLDHPLFRSVTHLDIYVDEADTWEDWSHLASLPALTHLCLSEDLSNAILPQVVAECRNLRVVVILSRSFNAPTVADSRVVLTSLTDYVGDWTKGAWGGDDIWVRAERFVAQKRRGEISSTRYVLD